MMLRAVLVGKSQSVTVAAGKYTATKIEIHVMDNGTEMKDAHFFCCTWRMERSGCRC